MLLRRVRTATKINVAIHLYFHEYIMAWRLILNDHKNSRGVILTIQQAVANVTTLSLSTLRGFKYLMNDSLISSIVTADFRAMMHISHNVTKYLALINYVIFNKWQRMITLISENKFINAFKLFAKYKNKQEIKIEWKKIWRWNLIIKAVIKFFPYV